MKLDLKEIYITYSDKIFRYLYWHVGDVYVAEDLTSEVFLRVFKNLGKFKDGYVQAWIYRIAKNLLIDHYRGKKTRSLEFAEEIAVDDDLIEKLAKDENAKHLKKAVAKLPENLREVVILRFFEEMSAAQVAEVMNLSEGNVRVLQFRGLKKLKEELNEQ